MAKTKEEEIAELMRALDCTYEEAEDCWLCDHDLAEDEEQNALDDKANAVKVEHGVATKKAIDNRKPRVAKVSDEKTQIFDDIVNSLMENYNIQIKKANKLIEIDLNGKLFKLDLVETRQK